MPVLELAVVWADIYHGLRRCFSTESRTVATQMPATNPQKKSRNRRRQIGRSLRSSRHLRGSRLTASDESDKSELPGYFSRDNFTASLTSCQELTRLEVMATSSSHLFKRQQLQERPLMLNAQEVIQVQWSNWWHTCWPTLVAASVQVSFGSSCLCHSLMGLYDEEEFDPPILVLMCSWGQKLRKLCKQADLAFCSAGPGPVYRTTSPAMELIDIRNLFQQLNEALVDYLLSLPDSETSFCQ